MEFTRDTRDEWLETGRAKLLPQAISAAFVDRIDEMPWTGSTPEPSPRKSVHCPYIAAA
jgi:hypothetical protein